MFGLLYQQSFEWPCTCVCVYVFVVWNTPLRDNRNNDGQEEEIERDQFNGWMLKRAKKLWSTSFVAEPAFYYHFFCATELILPFWYMLNSMIYPTIRTISNIFRWSYFENGLSSGFLLHINHEDGKGTKVEVTRESLLTYSGAHGKSRKRSDVLILTYI